jgi:hypothetical protein
LVFFLSLFLFTHRNAHKIELRTSLATQALLSNQMAEQNAAHHEEIETWRKKVSEEASGRQQALSEALLYKERYLQLLTVCKTLGVGPDTVDEELG